MPIPAHAQGAGGARPSPPDRRCQVRFLGTVPYRQAWALQSELASEIAAGRQPPTLLLLEHPHTFTLGRQAVERHLLWRPAECEAHQIEVHRVDRGGDITYHGPGQLVAYPLLPLGRLDTRGRLPQADYLGYLRKLEQVVIQTLADFGLAAVRLDGLTGVWVPAALSANGGPSDPSARPGKIAAIGVKVDADGISRHGLSLNLSPDMSYWQGIVPCGLPAHSVVSLAQLKVDSPTIKEAADRLARNFGEIFEFELI